MFIVFINISLKYVKTTSSKRFLLKYGFYSYKSIYNQSNLRWI